MKEREKRLNPIYPRRQGARVLKTFPLLQPLFQRFVRPDRQESSESPPPSLLFMSENTHTPAMFRLHSTLRFLFLTT